MAHPAPAHLPDGSHPEPGVGLPETGLPTHVREARDELFSDADRHGPRAPELLKRLLVAAFLLPLCVAVSTWLAGLDAARGDVVPVLPALLGVVLAGYLLAPLARVRTFPLVLAGAACLVPASLLVADGRVVAAAPIAAAGALLLGLGTARVLYRAVWVLPMLLVAGVSDAQSVQGGVTESLLDGGGSGTGTAGEGVVNAASALGGAREGVATTIAASSIGAIDYLVLHVPTSSGMWILGLVDVLAIGLLLGLSHLYWQPLVRTSLALLAALVLTAGVGVPVPVLPALGLAWALANASLVWRSTRFSLRRLMYLGG